MSVRHLPVRPDLEQLRHQAKDLLRELRRSEPAAVALFDAHHPGRITANRAKLADAQLVLARSYGVASWPRLVHACRITDAIWRDDVDALRTIVTKHPELLREQASGRASSNWGAPLTYAANIGRDRIIAMLHELGATDLSPALNRACLQGQVATARTLIAMGAVVQPGAAMGPAETLNPDGMQLLLDLGVTLSDEHGDRLAPVALVLQTYSRHPTGKHACLELLAANGIVLPDTPTMALHRGRLDLLELHLARDAALLTRTFTHEEIYPPSLGCHADHTLALTGTPLAGTTLLHLCVDYDEMELAEWLLARGADVNARADVDAEGFGGHTALFGCMVSQSVRCGRQRNAAFARMLLDHGAEPNARASLRKRLRFVEDETMHEYRDVTPVSWGERFHDQDWVSDAAIRLVRERGGHG